MGNEYKDVNDAKAKLPELINKALDEKGVWTVTTCATGAMFGWDMNLHYALEWFQRHCPERWQIKNIYRHECTEWTITER